MLKRTALAFVAFIAIAFFSIEAPINLLGWIARIGMITSALIILFLTFNSLMISHPLPEPPIINQHWSSQVPLLLPPDPPISVAIAHLLAAFNFVLTGKEHIGYRLRPLDDSFGVPYFIRGSAYLLWDGSHITSNPEDGCIYLTPASHGKSTAEKQWTTRDALVLRVSLENLVMLVREANEQRSVG